MNTPRFSAEASLYFAKSCYRGSGWEGDVASNIVLPQNSQTCTLECAGSAALCVFFSGGDPFTLFGCSLGFIACVAQCPSGNGGGGGGGGGPDCTTTGCPKGRFCCECDGFCLADNAQGHAACKVACSK